MYIFIDHPVGTSSTKYVLSHDQDSDVGTCYRISGNKEAMNLDYVVPLESSIVSPLLREGADGIPQALEVLSEYCLVREDLESLGELTSWPNTQNRFSQVESKVNHVSYYLLFEYYC